MSSYACQLLAVISKNKVLLLTEVTEKIGNLRRYYIFFWILTTTHCNKNHDRKKT